MGRSNRTKKQKQAAKDLSLTSKARAILRNLK